MKRPSVVAGLVVVVSVCGVVALASFTSVFAVSKSDPMTRVSRPSVTTYGDAQITATCDHVSPGSSLGLTRPTLVSRIDGNVGVIFATRTKYSACILWGYKNASTIKPTPLVAITKPIDETFSFATSDKIHDRALWATNTWFVVRVGPTVATLTSAARSSSQSSAVVDGFAFVHVTETADVHGKFAWGVAAGFSSTGELVGSETLH